MIQEELLSKIRRIELKAKKKVDSYLQGAYHTLFKGQGLEFEEVREYLPEDDSRRIDWNVTARMGRPFLKLYKEERELTVMIVADVSASTLSGQLFSQKEVLATLSASLAFSAIKNSDKAGLLLFSDEVEEYVPPRKGRNHLLSVIRSLLTTNPKSNKTNPETAFYFLNKVLKKKALVFFISDMLFDKFPESLAIASRRHEVIPIGVFDKMIYSDFSGIIRVENPEIQKEELLDFSIENKQKWQKFKEKNEQKFKKLGLKPFWIENKEDFINDLILGFKKMGRQRR
jgi:uncharacterized protein (DUF58 family)